LLLVVEVAVLTPVMAALAVAVLVVIELAHLHLCLLE
jgi:hypothetical protein